MGAKMSIKKGSPKTMNGGLVTVDSLNALGINNPVTLDKFITMEYKSNYGSGLSSILSTNGKKRVVSKAEDGIYRWKLQGATSKSIPLTECLVNGSAVNADDKVGIGLSQFQLVFPDAYFSDVDLMVGEKGSREGQIRVVGEPRPYGTGYIYNCELIAKTMDTYMLGSNFQAGKNFSKEYPLVEKTFSRKGAGFNYSGSFQMENTFSKLRFQDTVAGNAFGRDDKMPTWKVAVQDADGTVKEFSVWDTYKEYEQRMQMKAAKERMLMYSRSNRDSNGVVINKGLSGFSLDQGMGLEEQLEKGNVEYYSEFDINEFIETNYELSDNTGGFSEKSEVLVTTGKYGYLHAMNQIAAKAEGFSRLMIDTAVKRGKDGGFELDYNFTSFRAPNGALITFVVDSTYDDPTNARNSIKMSEQTPGLPGPANSYIYTVMNVGTKGADSNVEIIYVGQENDHFGFVNGIRSPYGSVNGAMSSPDDGYSVHYMTPEMMVIVRDTSRCLTYRPVILS